MKPSSSPRPRRPRRSNRTPPPHRPPLLPPLTPNSAFYTLSKLTHPDAHPADPTAPARFLRISAAYAVLRSPEARRHYDREVLQLQTQAHRAAAAAAGGSHFGRAGGRPASGLSRRRTQFRGPPPSFYRAAGWAGEGEGGAAGAGAAAGAKKEGEAGAMGGMGYGQRAWEREAVRHFDREAHLRTQRRQEERRREGRREGVREAGEGGQQQGMWGSFALIGGLIGVCVVVPMWVWEGWVRRWV